MIILRDIAVRQRVEMGVHVNIIKRGTEIRHKKGKLMFAMLFYSYLLILGIF